MNAPDIIKDPQATPQALHTAGIFVHDDGSRQWVGHMNDNTVRHIARKIAQGAMDKEDEIARKGYSILGAVNGSVAYDMLESEIERANDGQLFRQIVESHPLWHHLVDAIQLGRNSS